MKWLLIASVCLLCSARLGWATVQDDQYNKAVSALQAEDYAQASTLFDQFVKDYPSSAKIDDARISAGYADLQAAKYTDAVTQLAILASDDKKPGYRATALYFTSLAQFSAGQKESDTNQAATFFEQAVASLTSLINLCTSAPTADNKVYVEPAFYYRALAEYLHADYDAAEKDLLELIRSFPSSRSVPDYYLRLGAVYETELNQAVSDKKGPDIIQPLTDKTLATLDNVSRDPNALVQANEANMSKAEVLFMTAQLDSSKTDGYQKALEAYRQVRRKDDVIPLEQARIDALKKELQTQLQTNGPSVGNQLNTIISREEGRLTELKTGTDPVILALIRMAECYANLKQPDEARTILHRLAHASLPPDQQQEVDFQTLYSYVLGGQTQQADAALTDYLAKHGDDPNASGISYQIASKLVERKDYPAALAQVQRSLKDFPPGKGKYADAAIALEAQIYTLMGNIDASKKIIDDYLAQNPSSPTAINLLLTRAQNEAKTGDMNSALADFGKVKDNSAASIELRSAGDAGYISTLSSLQRFDDVIAEARNFQTQYATQKALPNVMLLSAMALAQKHDAGAIAALQAVAKQFPKEETAPFALFQVVNVYHQQSNVPGMTQAANDLSAAYPEAYPFLISAADIVGSVDIKAKKFDDAIALYQPLTKAPKADIAATANNKIGDVWLASAKSMGYYTSLPLALRPEAEKRLASSEQAYVETLKNYPDQLSAVGDAFDGLYTTAKLRRSWGMVKDADLENYLTKICTDLTSPDMQARVEMAKAGLVFLTKNGATQFPAALDRYKKVMAANPNLTLTRQETSQFGDLLLAGRDYATATKIYTDLLANAAANDQVAHGDAFYGLGAAAIGQGDLAGAKTYFEKLMALPQNGLWHPHILDAHLGVALADEKSGAPADLDEAKQLYSQLITSPLASNTVKASAMLGYGRLLEKDGYGVKPSSAGPTEFAARYYEEPSLILGLATPEQSAEGLYDAGQAYEKAGDKASARAKYDALLKTYSTAASDWASKATAAEAQLGT